MGCLIKSLQNDQWRLPSLIGKFPLPSVERITVFMAGREESSGVKTGYSLYRQAGYNTKLSPNCVPY
jgi:hypothetical protein